VRSAATGQAGDTAGGTEPPTAGDLSGRLRRWRWPLAGLAALLLYGLAGFFLAPWLIERQLPQALRTSLGREATIGVVAVNPFTLSLRLQAFELRDQDESRLAGFEDLFVDVSVSSIWNRALTLSELRITAPYLNVVRDPGGAINLLDLASSGAEQPAAESEALPRFVVQQFRLDKGTVDFTDKVPATPFRTTAGPFDLALDDLSTLPDALGRHQLAITLESGTRISVSGDLAINPLQASGELTLDGPALGLLQRYLKDQLRFVVQGGTTQASLRFALQASAGGSPEILVSELAVRLSEVSLDAEMAPGFFGFEEFSIKGGRFAWPAREVSAEQVLLAGAKVKLNRDADGHIDLVELLAPEEAGEPPPEAVPAEAEASWSVRIAEIALRDLSADVVDRAPASPAQLVISDLDVSLRGLASEPGARFPLEAGLALGSGGTVKLRGELTALPGFGLDADIEMADVALAPLQPYLSEFARVQLRGGTLGLDGHLASGADEVLAFAGDLRVNGLETHDQVKKERLLAWRELALDDLKLSVDANRLRVGRVRLDRPFGRVFIARDQSTNIGDLVVEPAPSAGAPAAEPGKPLDARVGRLLVRSGEVDFTDLSLPLPFAARVRELEGEFTAIDTRSAAPSRLRFEGRVDEYGLARAEGEVRASAPADLADVSVTFRNIEMAPLSPYSVKFAGRRIARGKIDLDLRYRLEDRRMIGANKIVIDELELGEKVPHPDAVDLPLGLAVALLKDAEGRIDLDMPVSGSLDDPEFAIGGVLWKAFVTLVTKVATAPFRLLGGLVGGGSEDLGRIDFLPGRADLLPPEREKLARVAEALGKRPSLGLEIPAVVDRESDATVLRLAKLQALVDEQLAATGVVRPGRDLERSTRRAVEALFAAQFPGESLGSVEERFKAVPGDDPQGKPRVDELAYLEELRTRVAERQVVSDEELDALGAARAAAIRDELASVHGIEPRRLVGGQRREVSPRDGAAWVGVELGLSGLDPE